MDNRPDLLVIGGGVGGYIAALRAASSGMRVALVERDLVGGTCLNVGCIPTKALLESARILRLSQRAGDFGIALGKPAFDVSEAVGRSRRIVETLRKGVESLLRARKVEIVRGNARLRDSRRVEVESGTTTSEIEAHYIVIATGSSWISIPGIEPDGIRVITSDHALFPDEIPASMVIVGAGAVGCEFAEIYSAFGTKVTLIEMMGSILPGEDKELARRLETALKRKGIEVLTSTKVRRIAGNSRGLVVETENGRGIEATKVLLAVGRKSNVDGIGLEEAGVDFSAKGIAVDSTMKTNVDGIFAIGDVTGRYMLAHVAMNQAMVAIENMLGRHSSFNYERVPRCVYTEPEYAAVGKTEEMARQEGASVEVKRVRLGRIGRALTLGETFGLAKIVIDSAEKRLLGLQILAPHASEFITEATLALGNELGLRALGESIHPHPTLSEIVWESALLALGKAIHAD